MNPSDPAYMGKDWSGEIGRLRRIIFGELFDRSRWLIRLRWFAPPVVVVGLFAARWIGFTLPPAPFLLLAVFILVYNGIFALIERRSRHFLTGQRGYVLGFARIQLVLDYACLLWLLHFTGGLFSPVAFFFIVHVVFAAMLLPARTGYALAALAAGGAAGLTAAESSGLLGAHPLVFRGAEITPAVGSPAAALIFIALTLTVFATAFFASSIIQALRRRIYTLVELTEAVRRLNERLNTLYTMTQAVGSVKDLKTVLNMATAELCEVMGVIGVSIKLLSDDGRYLQYVAADGLVADVFKSKVVEVAKSPLNRQIIEGKPFVTGRVKAGEMMFQFGEDLANANVRSVLFVPLTAEEKVIGIAGAYCRHEERFNQEEVDFFRQAAGLVAIAIENARSYEAIERLMKERSWFMLRVAHNLRAPLAAIVSMIDVLRGGYQGDLNENQREYLRRVHRRAGSMLSMIGELLVLSKSGEEQRTVAFMPVDLKAIATRIQRTFQDDARQRGLQFELSIAESLPPVRGNPDMLEQALENLVSNAVKYTPGPGKVTVEFSEGPQETVRIQISDTGIGIPQAAREKLFSEFFRAENAKTMEESGTGLGLAIVKKIVDQHNGRIVVESEEGQGTLFVLCLPAARGNDLPASAMSDREART